MTGNKFRKLTAVFALCCFSLSQQRLPEVYAAYPEPAAETQNFPPLDVGNLNLSKGLGKVEEVFAGTQPQTVILIQDAHAIPDAQKSIQWLIGYFQKKYGIHFVGLEGAASGLDPQMFKSFPQQEVLREVFRDYLERGELTAGTASAIFNSAESDYEGLEDWPLYQDGLRYYLLSEKVQGELLSLLQKIDEKITAQKEAVYSPALKEADEALVNFRKDKEDLLAVLQVLAKTKRPREGSQLRLILDEASGSEARERDNEIEVKKLAEIFDRPQISNRMPRAVYKEFQLKRQQFQTSQLRASEFALYLSQLASALKIPVPVSDKLISSMQITKQLKNIEGVWFFREFRAYTEEVKNALIQTEEERSLDRQSEERDLLERFARLQLDQRDWKNVRSWMRNKSERNLGIAPDQFSFPYAFYLNAKKRDKVLFDKLTRAKFATGERVQASLMVVGGFHAEGLTQLFRENGISYAVLMPEISKLPEENHYEEQMKGRVSWKNYLKVEDGKIDLYSAFVRGTRDKILDAQRDAGLGEFKGRTLKAWRDQIIRDLSRQGRITEASHYTRFIDEAADTGNEDDATLALIGNVKKFMTGMKELDQTGRLTPQNVAGLLAPSSLLIQAALSAAAAPRFSLEEEFVGFDGGFIPVEVPAENFSETELPGIFQEFPASQETAARSEMREEDPFEFFRETPSTLKGLKIVNKLSSSGSLKVWQNAEEGVQALDENLGLIKTAKQLELQRGALRRSYEGASYYLRMLELPEEDSALKSNPDAEQMRKMLPSLLNSEGLENVRALAAKDLGAAEQLRRLLDELTALAPAFGVDTGEIGYYGEYETNFQAMQALLTAVDEAFDALQRMIDLKNEGKDLLIDEQLQKEVTELKDRFGYSVGVFDLMRKQRKFLLEAGRSEMSLAKGISRDPGNRMISYESRERLQSPYGRELVRLRQELLSRLDGLGVLINEMENSWNSAFHIGSLELQEYELDTGFISEIQRLSGLLQAIQIYFDNLDSFKESQREELLDSISNFNARITSLKERALESVQGKQTSLNPASIKAAIDDQYGTSFGEAFDQLLLLAKAVEKFEAAVIARSELRSTRSGNEELDRWPGKESAGDGKVIALEDLPRQSRLRAVSEYFQSKGLDGIMILGRTSWGLFAQSGKTMPMIDDQTGDDVDIVFRDRAQVTEFAEKLGVKFSVEDLLHGSDVIRVDGFVFDPRGWFEADEKKIYTSMGASRNLWEWPYFSMNKIGFVVEKEKGRGRWVDPYGGIEDARNKKLSWKNPAEVPLSMMNVMRFLSFYHGFKGAYQFSEDTESITRAKNQLRQAFDRSNSRRSTSMRTVSRGARFVQFVSLSSEKWQSVSTAFKTKRGLTRLPALALKFWIAVRVGLAMTVYSVSNALANAREDFKDGYFQSALRQIRNAAGILLLLDRRQRSMAGFLARNLSDDFLDKRVIFENFFGYPLMDSMQVDLREESEKSGAQDPWLFLRGLQRILRYSGSADQAKRAIKDIREAGGDWLLEASGIDPEQLAKDVEIFYSDRNLYDLQAAIRQAQNPTNRSELRGETPEDAAFERIRNSWSMYGHEVAVGEFASVLMLIESPEAENILALSENINTIFQEQFETPSEGQNRPDAVREMMAAFDALEQALAGIDTSNLKDPEDFAGWSWEAERAYYLARFRAFHKYLKTGDFKGDSESVNLPALVQTLLTHWRTASGNEVRLELLSSSQKPVFVLADPDLWTAALSNILSNGLRALNSKKYKEKSFSPELKISVQETDQRVILTLQDNGPGFPENLPLLEPDAKGTQKLFSRGESASGSTGLGLWIVHQTVQRAGGDIKAERVVDAQNQSAGARFIISLPVGEARSELRGDKEESAKVSAAASFEEILPGDDRYKDYVKNVSDETFAGLARGNFFRDPRNRMFLYEVRTSTGERLKVPVSWVLAPLEDAVHMPVTQENLGEMGVTEDRGNLDEVLRAASSRLVSIYLEAEKFFKREDPLPEIVADGARDFRMESGSYLGRRVSVPHEAAPLMAAVKRGDKAEVEALETQLTAEFVHEMTHAHRGDDGTGDPEIVSQMMEFLHSPSGNVLFHSLIQKRLRAVSDVLQGRQEPGALEGYRYYTGIYKALFLLADLLVSESWPEDAAGFARAQERLQNAAALQPSDVQFLGEVMAGIQNLQPQELAVFQQKAIEKFLGLFRQDLESAYQSAREKTLGSARSELRGSDDDTAEFIIDDVAALGSFLKGNLGRKTAEVVMNRIDEAFIPKTPLHEDLLRSGAVNLEAAGNAQEVRMLLAQKIKAFRDSGQESAGLQALYQQLLSGRGRLNPAENVLLHVLERVLPASERASAPEQTVTDLFESNLKVYAEGVKETVYGLLGISLGLKSKSEEVQRDACRLCPHSTAIFNRLAGDFVMQDLGYDASVSTVESFIGDAKDFVGFGGRRARHFWTEISLKDGTSFYISLVDSQFEGYGFDADPKGNKTGKINIFRFHTPEERLDILKRRGIELSEVKPDSTYLTKDTKSLKSIYDKLAQIVRTRVTEDEMASDNSQAMKDFRMFEFVTLLGVAALFARSPLPQEKAQRAFAVLEKAADYYEKHKDRMEYELDLELKVDPVLFQIALAQTGIPLDQLHFPVVTAESMLNIRKALGRDGVPSHLREMIAMVQATEKELEDAVKDALQMNIDSENLVRAAIQQPHSAEAVQALLDFIGEDSDRRQLVNFNLIATGYPEEDVQRVLEALADHNRSELRTGDQETPVSAQSGVSEPGVDALREQEALDQLVNFLERPGQTSLELDVRENRELLEIVITGYRESPEKLEEKILARVFVRNTQAVENFLRGLDRGETYSRKFAVGFVMPEGLEMDDVTKREFFRGYAQGLAQGVGEVLFGGALPDELRRALEAQESDVALRPGLKPNRSEMILKGAEQAKVPVAYMGSSAENVLGAYFPLVLGGQATLNEISKDKDNALLLGKLVARSQVHLAHLLEDKTLRTAPEELRKKLIQALKLESQSADNFFVLNGQGFSINISFLSQLISDQRTSQQVRTSA